MPTKNGQVKITRPPLGEVGATSVEQGIYSPHSLPIEGLPSVLDLERMLHYDSQARALYNGLTLPLRAAKPTIEPDDGDSGEKAFVEELLFNKVHEEGMTTPFDQVHAQMCRAVVQRAAFFEKVWKIRDDGKLVYHKLAYRRPTTCNVIPDKNGSFNGFHQQGFDSNMRMFEKDFPPEKALVYIHASAADNPLRGESALESAYQDYQNKMKVSLLRYLWLQKHGIPPVVGKTDAEDIGEQMAFLKKLNSMSGGASVVFGPTENMPEAPLQATSNLQDFQATIDYLNTEMARSVQLQQIMLATTGSTSSGSRALSTDQTATFRLASEARQKELEYVWTNYCIAPAIYYNFGPNAAYPTLKFQPLDESKMQMIVDIFRAMMERGVITVRPEVTDAIEQTFVQFLGLTLPDADDLPPRAEEPTSQEASQAAQDAVGRSVQALRGIAGGGSAGQGVAASRGLQENVELGISYPGGGGR